MGSRREHYQFQYGTYAGPAQLKKENFPCFRDGDVKIIISGSRQYQLHSSILKIGSPLLARLLNDEFSAKLSKQAIKKGVVVRNRIVAVENAEPTPNIDLILEPVHLDTEGKPINAKPVGLDLENGVVVPPIYVAYELVLGVFYSRPLELGEFGKATLHDVLEMALEVLQVAEYLECTDMITKPFEAALLSTGQTLHRSIAKDPSVWLDFAYRIKSKVIFREALIHAAGQYNTLGVKNSLNNGTMNPKVAIMVVKRGEILKEGVKMALRKVLSYYPRTIQRSLTVGLADIDHIGRNSYGNDIMTWMALVAFRHYIMQHVANDGTHQAEDMGYALITAIGQGGDKYLDKVALEDFHRPFPMSSRGKAVMEARLAEIKDAVKEFVKPLNKNNSELDITRADHKYFTCPNIDQNDFPWLWDEPRQDNSQDTIVVDTDDNDDDGHMFSHRYNAAAEGGSTETQSDDEELPPPNVVMQ